MGWMVKQAQRLKRVDWNRVGPQALAQEICTIFESEEAIEITSPVTIGPTGDNSPLTLVTNINPVTGVTPDPITYIQDGGPDPTVPGSPPVPPVPPPPVSGSGNAFSAQVLNQVSGVNYNCTLYPGGIDAVVEMKNLAVDAPGADLAGAWVMVVQVSATEYHGFPTVLYGP